MEYITVKEFAELCGISQQAVYKQLNTRLRDYTKEVEGKKCIDRSAISVMKKEKIKLEDYKRFTDSRKRIDELIKQVEDKDRDIRELKGLVEIKEQFINTLQNELNSKNVIIEQLNSQNAHLIAVIDQEQHISMSLQLSNEKKKGFFKRLIKKEREEEKDGADTIKN